MASREDERAYFYRGLLLALRAYRTSFRSSGDKYHEAFGQMLSRLYRLESLPMYRLIDALYLDKDPVFGVYRAAEELVLTGMRDLILVLDAPQWEVARFNLSSQQAEKELAEIPSAAVYREMAGVFHEALGGQGLRSTTVADDAFGPQVRFRAVGVESPPGVEPPVGVEPAASMSLEELTARARVCAGPGPDAGLVGWEVGALRELLRRAIVDFIEPMGISHLSQGTEWRTEAEKFVQAVVPVVFRRDEATFGVRRGR